MSKYEYTADNLSFLRLVEELAAYDKSGWELVSHWVTQDATIVHCIFRKRIPRKKEVAQ